MISHPDTLQIVRKAEGLTDTTSFIRRDISKSVDIVSPQTFAQGFANIKPMPDPVTIVLQSFLMRNLYFLIPVVLFCIAWVRIVFLVFAHQANLAKAIPFILFSVIIAGYLLMRWRGWAPMQIRISSKEIAGFKWTELSAVYIVKRQSRRSLKCLLAFVKRDGTLEYIPVTEYYHSGQLQAVAAALRDLSPIEQTM
ncbi:hypothetical protein CLV59_105153 [Chitinophaga dinghuensis]|uniref:Uncharacterized protein n=1 Tax=Chitinophaga dinghuensis TaxID=1539050 RepID=A0A327VYN0_9BACT|nr:hypothetical protein [Chitinophaga dinghuensis]RAJ80046.1 hypothetical protein CLV59_105153 [Chitinophaga dinghuensis]